MLDLDPHVLIVVLVVLGLVGAVGVGFVVPARWRGVVVGVVLALGALLAALAGQKVLAAQLKRSVDVRRGRRDLREGVQESGRSVEEIEDVVEEAVRAERELAEEGKAEREGEGAEGSGGVGGAGGAGSRRPPSVLS